MRLDDGGIAGREAGEEAGIEVPGRKGRAADLDSDAARHDAEAFGKAKRLALALRLLPLRLARRAAHLCDRIGDRLEGAVLGVRTARLKGHAPRLAGGVLHRVRHEEALPVQPRQGLEQDPGARLDRSASPARARRHAGGDQPVDRGGRIVHAERLAVGRRLGADQPLAGKKIVERERPADESLEGRIALGPGVLAIDFRRGRFRIGAEIGAGRDRLDRALQQGFVTRKELRHRLLP